MAEVVIYLSPHPDDVALACGASAAADAAAGAEVTLLTLFSRGAEGPRRAAEDRAAAEILGVALRALGLPDAPERPEVRGRLGLFQPLGPQHLGILSEVVARLRPQVPAGARLYAPLGVGGHIDHRLAQAAAQALGEERPLRLSFYEDQPYSLARFALGRRLQALGARLPRGQHPERTERAGAAAERAAYRRYLAAMPLSNEFGPPLLRTLALHVAARAAVEADRPGHQPGFPPALSPRRREVEAFAARRFAAIAAYPSQWPLLFPSLAELERRLRGGPGPLTERFWDQAPREL